MCNSDMETKDVGFHTDIRGSRVADRLLEEGALKGPMASALRCVCDTAEAIVGGSRYDKIGSIFMQKKSLQG